MTKASEILGDLGGYFNNDEMALLCDEDKANFTITRYKLETLGRDKDEKPVIYFSESKKGLILNKGRAQQLAAITGKSDVEGYKIRCTVEKLDGIKQIVIHAQ